MEQVGIDNGIDEKCLSYYTEGEIISNAHRQLGAILPLIDSVSNAIHLCTDLGCDPIVNIVPVEQSRPYVAPRDDCSIMVLEASPTDPWDVDEIVDLNRSPLAGRSLDVDKVVDINIVETRVIFFIFHNSLVKGKNVENTKNDLVI
ncbi:hypothetical protein RHMOL_Rhmol06G0005400 [Rhododendron molle]|uniref:Uncharacterized protein n=1 Tax=Rhododendron molle TaxID=49168 RepID=A0ACC0N8U6_RHOML|nr:hypothetical protein RHMOL_Rhmol06G0005400 [Rhododendron molle]